MQPSAPTPSAPPPPAAGAPLKRPKIFYGWWIVAAATIQGFINFGVFSIGQSLFVKDVRDEFGWGVGVITIGFSIRTLESGIMAPFGGFIIDRMGAKWVSIVCTIVQTIGMIMFATMTHLWQFYASSVIVALGQGLGAGNAFMNPVVYWFNRKRGRASAIVAMGRGVAFMGVYPISVLLTAFGWRTASLVSAFVFFAISIPCSFVIRERPEPYGYLPDGEPPPPEPTDGSKRVTPLAEGMDTKAALKTRTFWLLVIGGTIFGLGTSTQSTHILTHLRYGGLAVQTASVIVSFYGAVQVVARLASGWIGDRVGRSAMLVWSALLMAVGWVAIAYITPTTLWLVGPYYLFYGFGHAAGIVTQQTVIADYFGPRRFATLRGIMSPMTTLGSLLGPLLAGMAFDHFGTFRQAFLVMAPIVALSAVVFALAGKPQFVRSDRPVPKTAAA